MLFGFFDISFPWCPLRQPKQRGQNAWLHARAQVQSVLVRDSFALPCIVGCFKRDSETEVTRICASTAHSALFLERCLCHPSPWQGTSFMEVSQCSARPAQCYRCRRRSSCSSQSKRTKTSSPQFLTAVVGNLQSDQGQWRVPDRLGQPDSSLGGKSQAKVCPVCAYMHVTFVLSLSKLADSRSG